MTEAHLKLNDSINTKIAARSESIPVDETVSEFLSKELQPLVLMEDHLEQMSLKHSESQQSIQSISQSLSSLASHMSQLLERTQLGELDATTSPGITDSKNRQTEWCCDALSGIDDAFEEDDLGQQCIFCAQRFTENEEARKKPELSYIRGKHLTDVHLFGNCNLSVTYKTLEEFEVHLDEYHHTSMDETACNMVGRFRRQKDPLRYFRGDAPVQGQPSIINERSTLGLLLNTRLSVSLHELDERGIPWMPISDALELICTYPSITGLVSSLSDQEYLRKLYYDIMCIEEELIVSGNESRYRFLDHTLEAAMPKLGEEREEILSSGSRLNGTYTQRNRINDWFLQVLKDSRTLMGLLKLGKVTPELAESPSTPYASMIAMMRRVIEFWGHDEAATGFEQLYETSDGAVDSRDDLKVDIGSQKISLLPTPTIGNTPNARATSAEDYGFPHVHTFPNPRETMVGDVKPAFSNDLSLYQSNGIQQMTGETPRNIYPPSTTMYGSRDQYSSYVTKSRSGSMHSGSSVYSGGSSVSYDDQHRTLPRPSGFPQHGIPPSPQSMMGQFSSKVSSSTEKKHKCKVCDKRFTRPSSLQTHMYSHTGEKRKPRSKSLYWVRRS